MSTNKSNYTVVESKEISDLNKEIDRGILAAKSARKNSNDLMEIIEKLKIQNQLLNDEVSIEKIRAIESENMIAPLKDSLNRLTSERSKWVKKIKRLENKN